MPWREPAQARPDVCAFVIGEQWDRDAFMDLQRVACARQKTRQQNRSGG
jgi:hypothetical protein